MINVINSFIDKNNTYICVSRPRRIGKTMATNMLAAYYSKGCDSKEAFSELNISNELEFESKLNKYNVIKIDLNGERYTGKGLTRWWAVLLCCLMGIRGYIKLKRMGICAIMMFT